MFGDIEIEKRRFLHCKNPILLKDVDIKRMQVSRMVSSGKKNYKYLIGYWDDDHRIKQLYTILPKTITYIKSYDGETKRIYFLLKMMSY